MGLYTNSSRWSGVNAYPYSDEIAANESYNAAFGCARIMMDVQQNDMAFFEAAIRDDVQEVMAYNEGVSYVNENAFTDVLKKIVELFKKLIAKIKGIIKSFIVKLTGAFRDSKKMVKKYENQIIKYTNWTGFKVKDIRVPKSDKSNIIEAINTAVKVEGTPCYNNLRSMVYKKSEDDFYNYNAKEIGKFYDMEIKKINDSDYDKETIRLNIIKHGEYFKGVNSKITSCENTEEVKEVVYDELWDDAETIDDDVVKSGSYFTSSWIRQVLVDEEKTNKAVTKKEKELNGWIDKIITELNKAQDDVAKIIRDGEYGKDTSIYGSNISSPTRNKTDVSRDIRKEVDKTGKEIDGKNKKNYDNSAEKFQQILRAAQTIASNEQEVITMNISIHLDAVKFAIAQARKVWTAAAAWSSGVHKEGYEYINALAECAEEEFYSNMESI